MNYELLLRPFEQGGAFSSSRVHESLSRAEFSSAKDKTIRAVFELREGKLTAERFLEEDTAPADDGASDTIKGLNLEFPLSLSRADADMAVAKVFELSQNLGALVFDPQAGQEVKPSDHGLVMDTWHRSVGFQADVVGSVTMGGSAPELMGAGNQQKRRMGLYILGIIVLLAVVYMARRCAGADDTASESYVNSFAADGGGK